MNKICIVIPYFGKWPNWFGFFLKSCEFDPTVNWLIYTDCKTPESHPKNIEFIKSTLNDFNKLASKKLGFEINVRNPYKICDFRPAFGVIFGDYLKGYGFWGHGDLDVIYGNIRRFITDDILKKYDIITSLKEHIVGHFTLFKNTQKINEIFKNEPNYNLVFKSEADYIFDEKRDIALRLVYKKPLKFKTLTIKGMTKLVEELENKNQIKTYFDDLIADASHQHKKFKLIFNKGKLFEEKTNKEFLYFHIHRLKDIVFCQENHNIPDLFYITSKKIFYNEKIRKKEKILRIIKIVKKSIKTSLNDFLGDLGAYLWNNYPKIYYKLKKKGTILMPEQYKINV